MKKILVIDDSSATRKKVKSALSGEFHVVEAVNGNDGIAKARVKKDLNLIISDLNMPGEFNGLQMVEEIRKIEHHKTTPVFMFTTETGEELKRRGKLLGITSWIIKPCDEKTLLEVVTQFLNQYDPKSKFKL
ncbi:MAG: response regulator [Oligoflexales bacterium]